MRILSDRGRIVLLLGIMAGVAITTAAVAIWLLYQTALDQQRSRLVELAQAQARLIEAVARFNAEHGRADFPGGPAAATLEQLADAHAKHKGFGETGEFTLARRQTDKIVFLLSHRHFDLDTPKPVPWDSDIAEPMRRALSGRSGTVIAADYRGVSVLAAHEPVADLGLGIVAKIDMAEVRRPFLRAAGLSGLGALLIIALGTVAGRRIGAPMVARLNAEAALKESEAQLRLVVDNLPVLIVYVDADQRFRLVNRTCAAWYGRPASEIVGKYVREIHGERYALFKPYINRVLSGESFTFEAEVFYPAGETRDIRSIHVPHVDSQGTVRGYFSLTQDITESKRAERALRESEERLRNAIESISEGFVLFDSNDRLVLFNEHYRRMNQDMAHLLAPGLKYETLLHAASSHRQIDGVSGDEWVKLRLARHREPRGPFEERHENGRWYRVEDRRTSEGGYVGIRTDITEHKRAEEEIRRLNEELECRVEERTAALRESQARLRAVIDNIPSAISLKDKQDRYLIVNKTFERWFHKTQAGLIGKTPDEALAPELAKVAVEQDRYVLETENASEREVRLEFPDGATRETIISKFPVRDMHGTLIGVGTIQTDLTSLKNIESVVAQQEADFRQLADAVPVFLTSMDKDFHYRLVNKRYKDFFGVEPSELIGKTSREVIGAKAFAELRPFMERALQGEPCRVEKELEYADGRWAYVRASYLPQTDADGNVLGIFGLVEDLTDRKRLEVQLLRKERLAALGELTGTVAHEIRNPLGVIASSMSVIRQRCSEAALDLGAALDRSDRGIKRCDRIITELLDFARAKGIQTEPTALDPWLSRVFKEQQIPEGIAVKTDLGAEGVAVHFDPEELRRAVINLIDNACQAMTKSNGEENARVAGQLTVTSRAKADRVEIEVADDGPGIPKDDLSQVLEPLFSTKPFGTGLGLPIVQRIMDEHDGGLAIESEEGGGVRVVLWLPRAAVANGN